MAVTLSFNEGTLVTVTASFASETQIQTDPTTVTLKYQPGTHQPAVTWVYGAAGSITRTGTGVYVAELDTTSLPGPWVGEWLGTGACQVTQPFGFTVVALPLN